MKATYNNVTYELSDIVDLMNYLRRYDSQTFSDLLEEFKKTEPMAFVNFLQVLLRNPPK